MVHYTSAKYVLSMMLPRNLHTGGHAFMSCNPPKDCTDPK